MQEAQDNVNQMLIDGFWEGFMLFFYNVLCPIAAIYRIAWDGYQNSI